VVLELSPLGEVRAEEGTLEALIRDALSVEPEYPIFIPCVTYSNGKDRVVLNMMEGYAFVASGLPEPEYLALTHNCVYVQQAMFTSHQGVPVLSTITDQALDELRTGLKNMVAVELAVGMRVEVVEGPYSNMKGQILSLETDVAHVYIELRSLRAIRSIPRTVLRPVDQEAVIGDNNGI
jgi:transcription antitermination factor NusG